MRARLLLPLVIGLAATTASAGTIEDLFRKLIDQRKSAQSWVPQGVSPQMAHELTKPEVRDRKDGIQLGREQYAIFISPRCRSCDTALASLKKMGLKIEVLDLSSSQTAREAFELTGATGVPTVLVGQRMLGGWSDKAFRRLMVEDGQQKAVTLQGTGA